MEAKHLEAPKHAYAAMVGAWPRGAFRTAHTVAQLKKVMVVMKRGAHWSIKREAKLRREEDIKFFGEDLLENYIPWLEQPTNKSEDGE